MPIGILESNSSLKVIHEIKGFIEGLSDKLNLVGTLARNYFTPPLLYFEIPIISNRFVFSVIRITEKDSRTSAEYFPCGMV